MAADVVQLEEPYASVFRLCRLQAATDGAFDQELLLNLFWASWSLCADLIGLIYPPREIKEDICISPVDGSFRLSYQPTSQVEVFDGYRLVATLPPNLVRDHCAPSLCCLCHPWARYQIGSQTCDLPPRFTQAVCRLFAYLVENRGDTEMDPHILQRCGAMAFLSPDVAYIA